MNTKYNRFAVCFFDVLGFETKFKKIGLGRMLENYQQLIRVVDERNQRTKDWFGNLNFSESAYWTSEQEPFISNKIYGAYASDSILLFSFADFPENRYPEALNLKENESTVRASNPATGWMYHPIPCDNFLDVCNEIICHSIEIGLPLRGSLSLGEAVLHLDRGIFLGQPLIDAARLESNQKCIGVTFSKSFMSQVVPNRYQLPFNNQFKNPSATFLVSTDLMLDWPRHWRNTRNSNLENFINNLNSIPEYTHYYRTTLETIESSNLRAQKFNSIDEMLITKVYPQFSNIDSLQLKTRLFRSVDKNGKEEEVKP